MNIHLVVSHLIFVMIRSVIAHIFLWIFAGIISTEIELFVRTNHLWLVRVYSLSFAWIHQTSSRRLCLGFATVNSSTSSSGDASLECTCEEKIRDTLCRRRTELPVPGALAEGGVLTHDARALAAVTLYSPRGPGRDIFSFFFSTLT